MAVGQLYSRTDAGHFRVHGGSIPMAGFTGAASPPLALDTPDQHRLDCRISHWVLSPPSGTRDLYRIGIGADNWRRTVDHPASGTALGRLVDRLQRDRMDYGTKPAFRTLPHRNDGRCTDRTLSRSIAA